MTRPLRAAVLLTLALTTGPLTGCSTPTVATPDASGNANAPITTPATGGVPADAQGPFPVERVVDGDTFVVTTPDGAVKVRTLGIDTPETVDPDEPVGCFGPQASEHAKSLLDGASVYLAGDPTQDRTDRYGRELDYVWLADGTLFQQVMLAGGYAREYTYDAVYSYRDQFLAAQGDAQASALGVWSAQCATTQDSATATAGDGQPFTSCAQARAAGAAPLTSNDPRYTAALDGDGDGTACE